MSRNCRSKTRCYRCKSFGHHTAICMKDARNNVGDSSSGNQNVETAQAPVVNSRMSVLLQTASGIISDTGKCVVARLKSYWIRGLRGLTYRKGLSENCNYNLIGRRK